MKADIGLCFEKSYFFKYKMSFYVKTMHSFIYINDTILISKPVSDLQENCTCLMTTIIYYVIWKVRVNIAKTKVFGSNLIALCFVWRSTNENVKNNDDISV